MLAVACGRPIMITRFGPRQDRDRGIDISGIEWFDDAEDGQGRYRRLRRADGRRRRPGLSRCRRQLTRGLHVVTANKALLAYHGVELATIAEEKGALLNFEAAVAGGIPVIKALRESLTGNTVSRVYGIMNGTCNYILTRWRRRAELRDCLKEAQRLGYAEADPAFDIEGNDTAHKLSILTTLAFGTQIAADDIYLEGITNISLEDIHAAADLGYRIKLLGVAQKTDPASSSACIPTMVPQSIRSSPRSMASPMRWRSNPTCSANC
jgi:homoserine dehydrogenase